MDTWLIILGVFVGFVGLFYGLLISTLGYWRKRSVAEAKSYPGIGSFPSAFTQKRHVAYDVDEIYRQYRDTDKFVGVYGGRVPQLLIIDPELIHKIYVNDFKHFHDNEFGNFVDEKSDLILANNPFVLRGKLWKERRLEMVPGMSPNRIKSAYPVTMEVCQRLVTFIKEQSKVPPKDGLDAYEFCLRYTAEVVSDCVLGIHVDTITDKPSHLLNMIQNLFKPNLASMLYQLLVSVIPSLVHILKIRLIPKSVEKYFVDFMSEAIELRRKQNDSNRIDFLNFLLELQDKKKLPTSVMTSNIMTFLTDGFITTAHTIAHCLLGLARNPAAQQKLREEILQNTNEKGELTFEAISEMAYLNACFNEALRLFPPLIMVTKLCTEPYEFVNTNGNSYKMNRNEVVAIPHYSLHHDERFYEDAEEFKPERFLSENEGVKKYRDAGKFLGFGDGPRICMGMRFALTQGKAAIAELVRNFQLKVNTKTRNDNQLDRIQFLASLDGGVWLDFEAIN